MVEQNSVGFVSMAGEEVEHIYEQRFLIDTPKGRAAAAGYARRRKAKTWTIRPNAPQNQV